MLLFRLVVFICIAVSPCPTVAFVVGPTPRSLVCPLQASSSSSSSPSTTEYDTAIDEAKAVLNRAAETKREDPELVMNALQDLEKLMRQKAKADPKTAEQMLSSLNGNWRLVFTTGTKDTQKKIQGKINYFPLKVRSNMAVFFVGGVVCLGSYCIKNQKLTNLCLCLHMHYTLTLAYTVSRFFNHLFYRQFKVLIPLKIQ
jgi:hypothetical protein